MKTLLLSIAMLLLLGLVVAAPLDDALAEITKFPDWVAAEPKVDTDEITRLATLYLVDNNTNNPKADQGITGAPVNQDGTMNLAVFPDFDEWDCTAYRGQGEYECSVDRCRAMMQVKNFTLVQTDALCGNDWRQAGMIILGETKEPTKDPVKDGEIIVDPVVEVRVA